MTPVFACGFECGVNASHWSNSGVTQSYNTNASFVRSGARSFRVNPTTNTGFASIALSAISTIHIYRVYVYFSSLPTVSCELMTGTGSAGSRPGAYFNASDSKIYAGNGVSALGVSGVSVTTGQWYRLDIKIIGTSDPVLIDVNVDGAACGQRSWSGSTFSNSNVLLGASSSTTCDMYFDDVVISATSADYPIGAGYVNHFIPTADGTHNVAGTNDFELSDTGVDILNTTTDAFEMVNDVPLESSEVDFINMKAPPSAADYVECIFGAAPGISTPTDPPRAVEVIAAIHQAGATAGNMEIRINDNGTEDAMYSATGVTGVTTLAYKRKHYGAAIAGGGAWVIGGGVDGDFTDLRVRFGSPATLDVNPDQYFDCIMIEAEFEEIAVVPPIPNKIYQKNQAVNRAATY